MSEDVPAAEQTVPHTVRRAVLPWRRRIRNISRFDFTPLGGFAALTHDLLGRLLLIVFFPLWLPALVVSLFAGVEVLLALLALPFALVYRGVRGAWPVEVHDAHGRLVKRVTAPDRGIAGRWAQRMRDEIVRAEYDLPG